MDTKSDSPTWVIIPEEGTVHVWLEHPPSRLEWDEIESTLTRYAPHAGLLELEGPGWSTPSTWRMARVLQEAFREDGVEVESRSATLSHLAILEENERAAPR